MPPPPPPHNKKAPGLNPNPKPIGPAKMTAGQKAARDARAGPKLPANANQAIKTGELGKGHTTARHISISHTQMVERTHGKDPGAKAYDPRKQKEVVTKFATKTQANKAINAALKNPQVQQALKNIARQPVGAVGNKVTVKLPKPVKIEVMRRPEAVSVGGKKVFPEGPPNLTTQTVKKISIRPENTPKGPGLHTGFPVPKKGS